MTSAAKAPWSGASEDQQLGAGGQASQRRGEREAGKPNDEGASAPNGVGQVAAEEQEPAEGEDIVR